MIYDIYNLRVGANWRRTRTNLVNEDEVNKFLQRKDTISTKPDLGNSSLKNNLKVSLLYEFFWGFQPYHTTNMDEKS